MFRSRFSTHSTQLPNVLCVGVPKAATTWLYARLNEHPEVFLPNGKELHFFSEHYSVKTSNAIFDHEKTNLFWSFRINLSSRHHWQWYRNQFSDGDGKIKLDITPTYCRASRQRIEAISQFLPDAKIILIIRNPIDRVWSGAGYFMDRYQGKSLSELDVDKELKPWVFDSERLDYGNYIDMITNWDSVYPDEASIKYIFYDDIKNKPREVLEGVCQFIGVNADLLPSSKDDEKKVNSNYSKTAIPTEIKQQLVGIYRSQIDFLESRFDRDLSAWR